MEEGKARTFLRSLFGRDHDGAALSRRDILAGIGLAGLFVAAPKLLTSSVAEAKTLAPAGEPAATDAADRKGTDDRPVEHSAADDTDVTDLSARRYWRRRYYRRRYYRRYYRRRYWRRRYWRRRYWRRRYWRRRYW